MAHDCSHKVHPGRSHIRHALPTLSLKPLTTVDSCDYNSFNILVASNNNKQTSKFFDINGSCIIPVIYTTMFLYILPVPVYCVLQSLFCTLDINKGRGYQSRWRSGHPGTRSVKIKLQKIYNINQMK